MSAADDTGREDIVFSPITLASGKTADEVTCAETMESAAVPVWSSGTDRDNMTVRRWPNIVPVQF